jgi:hypothetical protein
MTPQQIHGSVEPHVVQIDVDRIPEPLQLGDRHSFRIYSVEIIFTEQAWASHLRKARAVSVSAGADGGVHASEDRSISFRTLGSHLIRENNPMHAYAKTSFLRLCVETGNCSPLGYILPLPGERQAVESNHQICADLHKKVCPMWQIICTKYTTL